MVRLHYPKGSKGTYTGRNGLGKCSGIELAEYETDPSLVVLRPLNLKGDHGAASLRIPRQELLRLRDAIDEFINQQQTNPCRS